MAEENDTSRMMKLAVEGGAADTLGMILEQQARDREWAFNLMLETKDAEIELLTRQRDEAWEQLDTMLERMEAFMGFLLGGETPSMH